MSRPVDRATARWATFLKEAKRYFRRKNNRPGSYEAKQHRRAYRRWARSVARAGGALDD